jgi:hypothetical protein
MATLNEIIEECKNGNISIVDSDDQAYAGDLVYNLNHYTNIKVSEEMEKEIQTLLEPINSIERQSEMDNILDDVKDYIASKVLG